MKVRSVESAMATSPGNKGGGKSQAPVNTISDKENEVPKELTITLSDGKMGLTSQGYQLILSPLLQVLSH